jgi:23S rRNA (uracil1939-C5)-methyltransferase
MMKKLLAFHTIEITKIGHGGIGVAKAPDGKKILIKGGILPGSIVDLQTTRKYRDYYEARVTHIHNLNTEIIDAQPLCPHFANPADPEKFYRHDPKYGCGGCKLQMISYAVQLKLKQELIDDSFRYITDVL